MIGRPFDLHDDDEDVEAELRGFGLFLYCERGYPERRFADICSQLVSSKVHVALTFPFNKFGSRPRAAPGEAVAAAIGTTNCRQPFLWFAS
jgi:hypothetical protein